MTCYVYVMVSPGGSPVKVGMSEDPQGRLKALRGEFKRDLTLWRTWLLPDRWEAGKVERAAHRLLGEPAERREWFNVSLTEAAAAIERAIEGMCGATVQHESFSSLPDGWERSAPQDLIWRYQQARSAQIVEAESRLGRMMSRVEIQQRQAEGNILR